MHAGPFSLIVDCVASLEIIADEPKMRLNETFAWDKINRDSWRNFTIAGVSTGHSACPIVSYELFNATDPWVVVNGNIHSQKYAELPPKPINVTLNSDCLPEEQPCDLIRFGVSTIRNHTFYVLARAVGGAWKLLPTYYRYVMEPKVVADPVGGKIDTGIDIINNTVPMEMDFETIGC